MFQWFFDTTVTKQVNIPKCKIRSPHSFLHATFIEERIKEVCSEVKTVDVDVFTGDVNIQIDNKHLDKLNSKLCKLKDRLGNSIKVDL